MAQSPKVPEAAGSEPGKPGGISVTPRAVGAAVLLILLVIFIVENGARTRIRFVIPVVHAPLWIALLAGVAVGVIAGYLLGRSGRKGHKH
jgi:uncharacterized integral membrane protein